MPTDPIAPLLTPAEIRQARRWLDSAGMLEVVEALDTKFESTEEAAAVLGMELAALSGFLRSIRKAIVRQEQMEPCEGCGRSSCRGCVWQVWARCNGRCYLCGWDVDPTIEYPHPLSGTLDHIIPAVTGGPDGFYNMGLAHYECNLARADRLGFLFEGTLQPPDPTPYHLSRGRKKAVVWRVAEYEHAVRNGWPRPSISPELLALVDPALR